MPGEPALTMPQPARLNGLAKTADRDEPSAKVRANGGGSSDESGSRAGSSNASSPSHSTGESRELKLEPSWLRPVRVGCGLNNLVNTCYLNSVLQVLAYTPPLVNFMHAHHAPNSCRAPSTRVCMLCVLRQHVVTVHSGARGSISPTQFIVNLKAVAKHFRPNNQEDAHEYLRLLLERLQQDVLVSCGTRPAENARPNGKGASPPNAIAAIFGGTLRSQVACKNCSHVSTVLDPFLDLSLDIRLVNRVEDALARFFAPEVLRDANAYRCERCKQKVEATKCFKLHSLPVVLTIHLKRFAAFAFTKLTKPVAYSETLDLASYLDRDRPSSAQYKLYAVISHLGSTPQSGHYVAYVRIAVDSTQWYLFDDSHVSPVSRNAAINNPNAYVLFYAKVFASQSGASQSASLSPASDGRMTASLNGVNAPTKINGAPLSPTTNGVTLTPRSKSSAFAASSSPKGASTNGSSAQHNSNLSARVNSVTQLNCTLNGLVRQQRTSSTNSGTASSASKPYVPANGFNPLSASVSTSNLAVAASPEKQKDPAIRNKIVFRAASANRPSADQPTNAGTTNQSHANAPNENRPTPNQSRNESTPALSATQSLANGLSSSRRPANNTSVDDTHPNSMQNVSHSGLLQIAPAPVPVSVPSNTSTSSSAGNFIERMLDELTRKTVNVSSSLTARLLQSAGTTMQLLSSATRDHANNSTAQVVLRTQRVSLVDYDDDDDEEELDATSAAPVAVSAPVKCEVDSPPAATVPSVGNPVTEELPVDQPGIPPAQETHLPSQPDTVECTQSPPTRTDDARTLEALLDQDASSEGSKQYGAMSHKAKSASPSAAKERLKQVFKMSLFKRKPSRAPDASSMTSLSSTSSSLPSAKTDDAAGIKSVSCNSAELVVDVRSIASRVGLAPPRVARDNDGPMPTDHSHSNGDSKLDDQVDGSQLSSDETETVRRETELRDSQLRKRNRDEHSESTHRSKQPRHADHGTHYDSNKQDRHHSKHHDRKHEQGQHKSKNGDESDDEQADIRAHKRRRRRSLTRSSSSSDDEPHVYDDRVEAVEAERGAIQNGHGHAASSSRTVSSLSLFKAHSNGKKSAHGASDSIGRDERDRERERERDYRSGKH